MNEGKFKRGMVFGVFDGLHTGHQYFLNEAAGQVDELIVIVTRPEIVKILKNKEPKFSLEERVALINTFNLRLKVYPGDATLGDWTVLKTFNPDIIFLGHDQKAIGEELQKMKISFIYLDKK